MRVLGLSFSGHGTAMCLVEDGRVVHAVNLERLTRVKSSIATLPTEAEELAHVLWSRGRNVFTSRTVGASRVPILVAGYQYEGVPRVFDFYEVFPAMLEHVTGERELARARIDLVVKTVDNIRRLCPIHPAYDAFLGYFGSTTTYFGLEHHLCHAYQAYLSSPFDDAAVLTIDATGEALERLGGASITTSLCVGEGGSVRVLDEVRSPSSVGAMYATVTQHLGFRDEQEGNTMALASFGTDRFYRAARADSVELQDGGLFELTMRADGKRLNWIDRVKAFCPPRERSEPITDDHRDLARGMQMLAEEVVVHAARGLSARTGKSRLAVAGGVALNCVANAKILAHSPFRELYVMPNAGDRGLSVGAALYGYHVILGGRARHPLRHDYLGRSYTESEIERALGAAQNTEYRRCGDIACDCAALIAKGRIIGWVQGGAEFGPRALGHRSILADPRTPKSKERLDHEIKKREEFRPYAPSVLAERADEYFEMPGPSPYMLLAVNTRPAVRNKIPGIVHVDGSARVQTVERDTEPKYHRLISKFGELTGVPMVLNTSFNGYGDPIVETPNDAVTAMHSMGLDALAVGEFLAWRAGSPP